MALFLKTKIIPVTLIVVLILTAVLTPLGFANAQADKPPTCGFTNISGCMASIANGMLSVSGFFTWVGGVALNQAINITILQMDKIVSDATSIEYAWSVLRDLANIGIIFALLAIGIATILQVSGYGMRELLLRLLVVALLINFSFFITKALIQVGNSFAVMAYSQLAAQQCPPSSTVNNLADSCISDKFMSALRLPTIYNLQNAATSPLYTTTGGLTLGKIMIVGVFGSIVLVIAGFVFLAGAILLVIRFVLLILLMILAPVAWVAYVLPNTRGMAEQWWSTLWRETFFAPAYIILLLAALWIAQTANFVGNTQASYADALLSGNAASAALFIHFAIIIGFLIAALILARQFGAYGSSAVNSYGQKWAKNIGVYARRGTGAATFGLAGTAGRQTIGRLAYKAAQREGEGSLKQKVAAGGPRGLIAKGQLGLARSVEKSNFDVRSVAGLGKELGIGTGQKGGYKAVREAEVKSNFVYAKGLGKHKEDYAQNVLKERSILSTIMLATAGRRAAADKILKPIEEKKERLDLNAQKRQAQQKLRVVTTEVEKDKLRAEIDEIDIKLDELKEKIQNRKKEEDQDSKKKSKEEGSKEKGEGEEH